MNKYLGDFAVHKVVRIDFNTINTSSLPTTLSNGSVTVIKDGTIVTPTTGAVVLNVDVDTVTGCHSVVIDTSIDTTTFSAGSDYAVRLAGTSNVGGNNVVGVLVGKFSIENRSITSNVTQVNGTNLTGVTDTVDSNLVSVFGTALTAAKVPSILTADGLDAVIVESGVNARQALSPILAACAGLVLGASPSGGTITIKAGNDSSKTRITAVVDANGNRSSVTITLPS